MGLADIHVALVVTQAVQEASLVGPQGSPAAVTGDSLQVLVALLVVRGAFPEEVALLGAASREAEDTEADMAAGTVRGCLICWAFNQDRIGFPVRHNRCARES